MSFFSPYQDALYMEEEALEQKPQTKMKTKTPEKSTTGDKCPWCGEGQTYFDRFCGGYAQYDCGSDTNERSPFCNALERASKAEAEVERLKVINADMRNFLSKAIHNEGFNEEQALKFIYQ